MAAIQHVVEMVEEKEQVSNLKANLWLGVCGVLLTATGLFTAAMILYPVLVKYVAS